MSALVLAAVAILVFGDLSAFREQAEQGASEALGVPVQITGDMRLRPSFPPVIELNDVRIGNPDWAFHDHLLQVERVFLTLSLGAALTGDIEVHEIEIDSFELILERAATGEHNWPTQPGSGGTPLDTVALTNGVMRWVDHGRGPFPELGISSLETALGSNELSLAATLSIRGHGIDVVAKAERRDPEEVSGWQVEARAQGQGWSLSSDGEVGIDFSGQHVVEIAAKELSVLNDLHGLTMPTLGPVTLDATVSTGADSISASDLQIEVGVNKLRGELELSTGEPAPRLRATIDSDHLQLADLWQIQSSRTPSGDDYLDTTLPIVGLALGGIDADLTITAKALFYQDVSVGDAKLRVRSSDGTGEVIATASVLSGEYEAHLSAVTGDSTPGLTLEAKATALDLDNLTPSGDRLPVSGDKTGAALELSATGKSLRELLESLDGDVQVSNVTLSRPLTSTGGETLSANTVDVRVSNGVLSGFDIDGKLDESSLLVNMSSERPVVSLGQPGTWPLAGTIKYADAVIAIDGELEPLEPASYRGALETSGPDVNTLGRLLGFAAVPPITFRVKSQIETGAGKLSLTNLSAALGASRFEGNLDRQVDDKRVRYRGSLTATVLDPVEILSLFADINRDGWLPEEVDGELSLRVGKLVGSYEEVSDIEITAALQESRLTVAPFRLAMDGKPVRGEMSIDENVSPTEIGIRLETEELDTSVLNYLGVENPGLEIDIGKLELDAKTRGHVLPGLIEQLSLRARAVDASIGYTNEPLDTQVSSLILEVSTGPSEPLIVSAEGIHENFPLKLDLSIDSLSALIANQPITVSATTKSSHASVRLSGSIAAPRDLDGVEVRLESQGTRFEILHPSLWLPWEQSGEFRLETDLEHVDHQLTLRNLDAVVAGNDLRGTVLIPTDADGRVAVKLESASIAIGDVLEPADGEEETVTTNPRVIPSFPLADALPTQWNGDFEWHIGWLQLDDSVFKNLKLAGRFEQGYFHLDQTGVTHPSKGPFSLSLTIDPSAPAPAILKVAAEEFDLGWVLPNEADAKPHWPADIRIDLAGPAGTFRQLMAGASGVIELSAGQTEGAEFEKWDLNLLSRMLPKLGAKSMDQINCLVMHMDVDEGMGAGDGAVMETQHAVLAGGGAVDLRSETLELLLSARPKDKALLSVTASLRVEGTIGEPEVVDVSTDVAQILLGVANPFALLGSFVPSSGDNANTACEAALEAAEKSN